MKTNRWLAFVISAILLLAACSPKNASALAVPDGSQAGELSGLEPCQYQPAGSRTTFRAECGVVTAPENWDKPGSRLIALPVVRIPAGGSNPDEPVFYLQGGPGQSNLGWAPPAWLIEKHAVVFVGYRGVDGTVRLDCPEVSRLFKAHIGKDFFSRPARAAYAAATRECAASYQQAGVDLTGYTIPGVIQDMEAVRAALGYDRINLFSESYGTRVAQIYAYLHPDSLHRLVLIGVNTPGHFVWDPAVYDQMIAQIGQLCAQDGACSRRTSDFARTMYDVNRNMPTRWLVFNIDPDSVRLGANYMFFNNPNMPSIFDAYLAASEGDPSGLAMLNLMVSFAPIDSQVFGDLVSKAVTIDLERFYGIESVSLGNTVMGAPMAEWIWPLAKEWPVELIPESLRAFQESNVEMLLVNGALDFSTPPTALEEARPYYHQAQMVLLPEFSHTADVMTLQPQAFERLVTSYYDTGVADASHYVYQPLSFQPGVRMTTVAKLLVAAMVVLPALITLGIVRAARRIRRRKASAEMQPAIGKESVSQA